MKINSYKAFTLVELMIVILILGIITAIAILSYSKTSADAQKSACITNMKKIDSAIDQWALDNSISQGTLPSAEQEDTIYSDYLRGVRPKCQSGGVYEIHAVGSPQQVTCSRVDRGHEL